MRWLYIKNGDVVSQLQHIDETGEAEAGPNAFLADLLKGIKHSPALLMSWCPAPGCYKKVMITAFSFQVVGSRFGRMGNTGLRIRATFSGLKKILAFRPERIICGRIGPMLWVSALVAWWLKCPFIHSRHNSLYEEQSKWHQKLLSKLDVKCIRKANAVICHGPFLCAQMRKVGVPENQIIEFDVAFHQFVQSNDVSEKQRQKTKKVLFIGRVAVNKGVVDLLDAMQPLLNKQPDLLLQYIGDGPDLQALRQTIQDRGLENQVECCGRIAHADLPDYIHTAHVVTTPTRREFPEGRCLAAMEALACEIPLIAPDSGPFPYLVENNENGVLFKTDSVSSLSLALEKVTTNDDYYIQIKQGAEVTAQQLKQPIRTFYQAVELAFAV